MSLFRRRTIRERLLRDLVIVSMKTGGGYRGILFEDDRSGVLMMGPAGKKLSYIPPSGQEVPVDGQIFIPADEVEVIQVIGGS